MRGRAHYQQTFIDTYAKTAFTKLYDRKTPITAADLLNHRVVPFYDQHEVGPCRVLTDRGTEYCGNPEHHEYELYLAVEDVDHSRTKTKSPQTNGIVERFHKTVLNEFYRVAFRKRIYGSIAELQEDLDEWIRSYNENRPHQGRWCFGKTPVQTFLDATPLAREKLIAAYRHQTGETDQPPDANCPIRFQLTTSCKGRSAGTSSTARIYLLLKAHRECLPGAAESDGQIRGPVRPRIRRHRCQYRVSYLSD